MDEFVAFCTLQFCKNHPEIPEAQKLIPILEQMYDFKSSEAFKPSVIRSGVKDSLDQLTNHLAGERERIEQNRRRKLI